MIHEQQTEIYDIQYCAVALLKARTTYNLHRVTEMYKKLYGSKYYIIYAQMH